MSTVEKVVETEEGPSESNLKPPCMPPKRVSSDLDLMAEEGRIEGTLELGDGSSATIDTTVSSVESRVELATSKAPSAELATTTSFKLSRILVDDSDDGED